MTLNEFKHALTKDTPPEGVPRLLEALWHDARGGWDKAHNIVQDSESANAARVHAYLHRKEGDLANARYWYRRAGQQECHESLEQEWETLASELLQMTNDERMTN